MANGESIRSIGVFCGSSPGNHPAYAAAARQLGVELVRQGVTLVYGGGHVGLMGVIADAVLTSGGHVVGVIPRHLVAREIAHRSLSELLVVETMHERKQRMADLADAFILLPGGFGSWDEFCEIVTWSQLGLHRKPCGILNVREYYAPLLAMTQRAVEEGFIRASHSDAIVVADDAATLLGRLNDAPAMNDTKWIANSSQPARRKR